MLLRARAKKYKDTVCIGRTHGVHAEPTTFGLKLALWYDEANRCIKRMEAAQKEVSFGKLSGAVGTYSNIDPSVENYVCKKLGLKPVNIATQIIQRDIYAQYLCSLAVIASSLDNLPWNKASAAYGGPGGRRAICERPEGLFCNAA